MLTIIALALCALLSYLEVYPVMQVWYPVPGVIWPSATVIVITGAIVRLLIVDYMASYTGEERWWMATVWERSTTHRPPSLLRAYIRAKKEKVCPRINFY
jgi:hypothetical protein